MNNFQQHLSPSPAHAFDREPIIIVKVEKTKQLKATHSKI